MPKDFSSTARTLERAQRVVVIDYQADQQNVKSGFSLKRTKGSSEIMLGVSEGKTKVTPNEQVLNSLINLQATTKPDGINEYISRLRSLVEQGIPSSLEAKRFIETASANPRALPPLPETVPTPSPETVPTPPPTTAPTPPTTVPTPPPTTAPSPPPTTAPSPPPTTAPPTVSPPLTAPSAPTIDRIENIDSVAFVLFTAGSDGGSPITNYQYSLNGGQSFTAFEPAQTTSPLIITGLSNETEYTIRLKAVNAQELISGESGAVTYRMTDVYIPTIDGLFPHNSGSVRFVIFDVNVSHRNLITNYEYSIDNGQTFTPINQNINSSYIISGLTNGEQYSITVRAVYPFGRSFPSNTQSVTPVGPPSTPTIDLIQNIDSVALVYFTAGSDGGSPITNYQYSLDDGQSFTAFFPAQTTSPLIIRNLGNNDTYTIKLKAVNAQELISGESDALPYLTQIYPVLSNVQPYSGYVTFHIDTTASMGSFRNLITNYEYSLDNGQSFTAFFPAQKEIPFTISGLTNGSSYDIKVRAVSPFGRSFASPTQSVTPVGPPSAPRNLFAVPGPIVNQATITFTQDSDGGSPITNYQYSIDGSQTFTAFTQAQTTSPVIITILDAIEGMSYAIKLKAVNQYGASETQQDPIHVTIPVIPTPTLSLGYDVSTLAFYVGNLDFSQSLPIEYYIDNQVFTSRSPIGGTMNAFSMPPLTPGNTYPLRVRVIRTIDNVEVRGLLSEALDVTIPEKPTILSATPGNGQVTITFTPGANGSSTIANYEYDTFYEPFTSNGLTLTNPNQVTITGLTNGTEYNIRLRAVNAQGIRSDVTHRVTVTPVGPPAAPTIVHIENGYDIAVVGFTAGSDGGSPITNYQYSLGNGQPFIAFDPAQTTSPLIISGFVDGVMYTIRLKAVNQYGISIASVPVSYSYLSYIYPELTNLQQENSDSVSFNVRFINGDQYQYLSSPDLIRNYEYSINNGAFTLINPNIDGKFIISGLVNGVIYSLNVRALYPFGRSLSSDTFTIGVVGPPPPPTALSATPGNGQVTVSFSHYYLTNNNIYPEYAITNYEYSIDDGAFTSNGLTLTNSNEVTITGLTNGTQYTIRLKAVNSQGPSNPSASVTVTPVLS